MKRRKYDRFNARKKARIIKALLDKRIPIDDVCSLFGCSRAEIREIKRGEYGL